MLQFRHLDSRRLLDGLCFVALIALAAALRLRHLGSDSLWLDEAASWFQASQPIPGLLRATAADNYPPLHNLILHVAISLFGDAEWSLRLPSALLGTASVGLATLTAYQLRGLRVAIVTGLLLALSPFDIWYSQEARMYALLEFGSLAFAWSILRYHRSPSWPAAWLTTAAALLLFYTHLFGSFVWLALGAGAVLMLRDDRPSLIRLAKSQSVAAIGFLPWALILLHRSSVVAHHGFWVKPLTLSQFIETYQQLAGGGFVLVAMLIGMALAIRSAFDVRTPRDMRSAIGLLCIWFIVPPLVTAVISFVSVSLFLDRYLIGIVPAMVLLAAIGFDSLADRLAPQRFRRPVAWSVVGVLMIAVAGSWHAYVSPPHHEDWRSAARSVDGVITPADCVVLVAGFVDAPLRYYKRDFGKCFIQVWNPAQVTLPADPPPAVFVFSAYNNGDDDIVVKALANQGWHGAEQGVSGIRMWHLTRS